MPEDPKRESTKQRLEKLEQFVQSLNEIVIKQNLPNVKEITSDLLERLFSESKKDDRLAIFQQIGSTISLQGEKDKQHWRVTLKNGQSYLATKLTDALDMAIKDYYGQR